VDGESFFQTRLQLDKNRLWTFAGGQLPASLHNLLCWSYFLRSLLVVQVSFVKNKVRSKSLVFILFLCFDYGKAAKMTTLHNFSKGARLR
jgi:hypothetical protein